MALVSQSSQFPRSLLGTPGTTTVVLCTKHEEKKPLADMSLTYINVNIPVTISYHQFGCTNVLKVITKAVCHPIQKRL